MAFTGRRSGNVGSTNAPAVVIVGDAGIVPPEHTAAQRTAPPAPTYPARRAPEQL